MSDRPKLFAELCCGSAAVTLRLLGGIHAKPPISYQGSKRGYAAAILDVLGLRAGQGADAVLLCDPGPWSQVWTVLTTPEGCREVARIIRGWVGEEPRALWERLRATGPLSGKDEAALEMLTAEVAAWLWLGAQSYQAGQPESGIYVRTNRKQNVSTAEVSASVRGLPPFPSALVATDARSPIPSDLPPGSIVYIDPPYENTTGYADKLPRAEVLEIARRWSDASAIVCISKAEPMPLPGWHHVEITAERVGAKRTFSRQQSEWLTLNRPPAARFDRQSAMFALKGVE